VTKDESQMGDTSMLDLFRSEVETHAARMHDGLTALVNDPGARDRLDSVIRAAHSIRGGARIVELEPAERLAHSLEDFLVAAQKGETVLGPEQIDMLLKGVDMLTQIAEVAPKQGPDEISYHHQDVDSIITSIAGNSQPEPQGIKEPTLVQEPQPAREGEEPHQQATTASTHKKEEETIEGFAVMADPSMLDLFRVEVETHVATLNDGLLALENDPRTSEGFEALMRAAHSIKGGARIVGLTSLVDLAHTMEDCFVAAQKGETSLGSDQIDVLLKGSDMFARISSLPNEGISEWIVGRRYEIEALVKDIAGLLTRETAGVTSSRDSSAPPKLHAPEAVAVEPRPETTPALVKSPEEIPLVEKTWEAKPVHQEGAEKDRMVRVTAAKIERLMGQAGEVVVNARWLPPFSESLLELKKTNIELFNILEELRELLGQEVEGRSHDLLQQARQKAQECNAYLADRLTQFDKFTSTSATLSDRIYHEIVSVRMRPFADGVQAFPRMIRDLAKELGKMVHFEIAGKSTEVDRDILEKLDAPLNHLLRNAVDHGIEAPEERVAAGKPETGTLRLEATHRSGMLMITVSDDGRGVDLDTLRKKTLRKGLTTPDVASHLTDAELMDFLFLPGFSTAEKVTEISGRGVGLDVVHNMVHEVGGVVRAESKPGAGLTLYLELPLTLSVVRTFLVGIAGEPYAFPLARIDRCLELSREDIETVEDRQYFRFDNDNIALVNVHDVLEIKELDQQQDTLNVVVVSDRRNFYGLLVDKFLGEYDLVVRPLDSRLGKVPDINAVAVMLDGSPVLIFDVEDLVRSIDNLLSGRRLRKISSSAAQIEPKKQKRILVVDDSITVREMERKLLENRGYLVDVAVDGVDGWNAVRTGDYNMIISDVDMPRMNGIQLINQIKQHAALKSLPVIIVSYKDREEDRLMGLQAGADYYLTKGSFQDDSFIGAVIDLIGEP
jgi:two-component system sensor histidine kinase and response regulator WspE